MPMTKPKAEQTTGLRTPKAKKTLGLSVPPALRMPHEDLIAPASERPESSEVTLPSQTRHTTPTSQTRHTSELESVAPQRDFHKVANSIGRVAVPSGLFKGKSKQIYDTLYALTRGAIVPVRKVRISRPKLMAKAHIGSRVTFDSNVAHLRSVGLIQIVVVAGEHEGNEYEVFIPEELGSMPSLTSQTRETSHAQKLDRLDSLESSQTRQGLSIEESITSENPKTSFKTNTERDDDDATLAGLNATLKSAAKELTGKELSPAESERWKELAEVLVAELKIAAARTIVSSVPSFLAEHLRRRLWKVDKRQARAEGRELPDEAMKTAPSVNASKCSDCAGSGWWYPEGMEKGVKKCKHEKLTNEAKTDA